MDKSSKKNTISACIIAKNEEEHIGKCLKSLKNVVDEIIVVDTGSTDKTPEIAKEYGAKVYLSTWENDFSKARNEALDKASKDWIIYIDCDEYLDGEGWKTLSKKLDKKYEGYCLVLTNIIDGKKTLSAQTFRIFRNRDNYRFKGKIHEQVVPSILKNHKESDISFVDLNIMHTGYDEKEYDIEKKKERNFLIYENYPKEEKDGFFYYNLGGEYSRAGNKEKALECYIKSDETDAFDNGFRQYLAIYLTKSLFEAKRFKDAIEYSSKFIVKYEGFADLHFLRGTCYYYIGKFSEALLDIKIYLDTKGNINYPDFKLSESNNMEGIIKELEGKALAFEKSLFGIVLDYKDDINGTISKLSEYTDKLIVLVKEDESREKIEELEQSLCKVCKSFDEILESIRDTKYVMFFKNNEYVDRQWFLKTIEWINRDNPDIIESMALDNEENVYVSPRCIKTEAILTFEDELFSDLEIYNKFSKIDEKIIVMTL